MIVTQRIYLPLLLLVTIRNEGAGKDPIRQGKLKQKPWYKVASSYENNKKCMKNL